MSEIYSLLVVYVIFQRLVELVISRRHQAALATRGYVISEDKSSLQRMILVHLGWSLGLIVEPLWQPFPVAFELQVLALGVFLAAQAVRFWVLKTLGVHWNVSVMSPAETRAEFVSSGPYAYLRHPNYLVVCLEIASLPLVGGALVTATVFSVLNALILRRRIHIEERELMKRPGYVECMMHKPRLFWKV